MIKGKPTVPLSPPTSPRMSNAPGTTDKYHWQHTPVSSYPPPLFAPQPIQPAPVGALLDERRQPQGDSDRPSLRSHKSFPYSLGPSSRPQQEGGQLEAGGPTLVEFAERVTTQGPQPVGTSNLPPATYGGSAPTSPAGRLTPNSPGGGPGDELEDEEMGFGTAEQGDEEDRPPMTAAELRAHKRKMKRFRLTHNQTRFLMSEFARQPHPDAAHRERLSREIPGLSPRQVQVWFQNRRAKLKRLTSDDRERMMRSRALPANFDMTQALHAPFGAHQQQSAGTPMPSPGAFGALGEASGIRPLTLDTLRRVPEYDPYGQHAYASPTGITPALGAFAFTPPQSATETMSPASLTGAASNYTLHNQDSPRRYPFAVPASAHPGFANQHSHMPRLHVHDRFNRPVGESAGSPLRTSMSYSGLASGGHSQASQDQRSSSFSEHSSNLQDRPQQHRSLTGPSGGPSGPVGLGFTYANMPQYTTSEQQQHSSMHTHPSVDSQYRRSSSHLAGPPITSHQQPYPPPQFTSPHVPQYAGFGAQYGGSNFPSAYQHSQQSHSQSQQQHSFASVPSQHHQYVPLSGSNEQEVEEADNSEGGVPLPASY
ncbi:hypothetical protein LTR17_014411 [Elasticomyces elasticus]|nr:hypothetical protein LTR17_014411 [Elasticomyces elasticus]